MRKEKLIIFGLDSAPPELLFDEFIDTLPYIKWIVENGIHGPMKSTIPAITIPAWMVMATGLTPGELGLYGFRHRKSGTYNDIWIANSYMIKEKTFWDIAGDKGLRSIVVGWPPTYPPKRIRGHMISCFITPDGNVDYTYPRGLKDEIKSVVDEYIFDVTFRNDRRKEVLRDTIKMTHNRFRVIRYLMRRKRWNILAFVEIGLDRIHHAFWKYYDKNHHLYPGSGNKYESVIWDYYMLLDEEIGRIMNLCYKEDIAMMIVSDHGIKPMKGAFAINQWLIEEGLLKIKNTDILRKRKRIRFGDLEVDWRNTVAWGWGGYYARIFINVQGREPKGKVRMNEYDDIRDDISDRIKGIRGPDGERWNTKVFYPEEIYPVARGDKPDIMVYLDDLYWRSAGTLGYETNYLPRNDTGPDDAMHSEYGVFAFYDPTGRHGKGKIETTIYDVSRYILEYFSL